MWYVIQTMTGREEELVRMIRRQLSRESYTDCFVAYYERIWRKQRQSLVHVERLFPGYVFIVTENPQEIYFQLKTVPAMSKLISDGMFTFLPLEQGEEEFLRDMLADDHIIRLSFVDKDVKGRVRQVSGPLKRYLNQVERYQYKKRYALIRLQLLGQERTAALGIILPEDVRRELAYGKVETPQDVPEVYRVEREENVGQFPVGSQIAVVSGELTGIAGILKKVRKKTVDVGVNLFGQDISMEVPKESVQIIS